MLSTAVPDHLLAMVSPELRGLAAVKSQDYLAWVNIHGAVSAVLPGDHRLGLYPAEFEVVEFHAAPMVGASLEVMARDAKVQRGTRPFVFTNLKTGHGLDAVIAFIRERGMLG